MHISELFCDSERGTSAASSLVGNHLFPLPLPFTSLSLSAVASPSPAEMPTIACLHSVHSVPAALPRCRACMCACVHVCMCACVHVCMCACVYVCMCACVHVCMCACVYVCMCACVHVCMPRAWARLFLVLVYTYGYVGCVCLHACLYVCIYVPHTLVVHGRRRKYWYLPTLPTLGYGLYVYIPILMEWKWQRCNRQIN
jgi:hypothetical protein